MHCRSNPKFLDAISMESNHVELSINPHCPSRPRLVVDEANGLSVGSGMTFDTTHSSLANTWPRHRILQLISSKRLFKSTPSFLQDGLLVLRSPRRAAWLYESITMATSDKMTRAFGGSSLLPLVNWSRRGPLKPMASHLASVPRTSPHFSLHRARCRSYYRRIYSDAPACSLYP